MIDCSIRFLYYKKEGVYPGIVNVNLNEFWGKSENV